MQPLYEGTEAVLISLFSHGPLAKQGEVGKVSQFSRGMGRTNNSWRGSIDKTEARLAPGISQLNTTGTNIPPPQGDE